MGNLNVDFIDAARKFVRISRGDSKLPIEQMTKPEVAELIKKLEEIHSQMANL